VGDKCLKKRSIVGDKKPQNNAVFEGVPIPDATQKRPVFKGSAMNDAPVGAAGPRDLLAELADMPDTFPESWRPKPGDAVQGMVVGYSKGLSPYGEKWIVTLRVPADGKHGEYLLGVWLSHIVLLDQFKRLRPKPGERVAIKRCADHSGKGYAVFRVLVDRPEAAGPDWDALDVEAESVSSAPPF